ncbi:MAG: hypothetical protein U5L74_12580 [Ideonella sp.]|nr:hypothetical protein [Ideonella sp.]
MNRTLLAGASALALSGLLGTSLAEAVEPAKKPAPKASQQSKAKRAPKAEPPLPAAEGEQLAAAAMTHFGSYQCEQNKAVQVAMNPKFDGYIDVLFGKQRWTMKPVLSSTGALRLEDVKGQTLMLQIAHKSMLMDVKAGRRLVDECIHEKQAQAKAEAEGQAATPSLMGN